MTRKCTCKSCPTCRLRARNADYRRRVKLTGGKSLQRPKGPEAFMLPSEIESATRFKAWSDMRLAVIRERFHLKRPFHNAQDQPASIQAAAK